MIIASVGFEFVISIYNKYIHKCIYICIYIGGPTVEKEGHNE